MAVNKTKTKEFGTPGLEKKIQNPVSVQREAAGAGGVYAAADGLDRLHFQPISCLGAGAPG